MQKTGSELDLPGFRFHPTEEELLDYYLWRAVHGKSLQFDIIGTINLYRYDPWLLPGLAKIGEREWYFFVPRDRKQANGGRPNRTTERGFWKATGSDRPIRSVADPKRLIGLKKTLVYYQGRAPRGTKTNWVMNEYRLPDIATTANTNTTLIKEDIVICKIYRKAASMKELEQRAAMEEETRASVGLGSTTTEEETMMMSPDMQNLQNLTYQVIGDQIKEEAEAPVMEVEVEVESVQERSAVNLPELQIPKRGLEWMQDSFFTQLCSPWMVDQWSPYANLLNF